MSTTVSPTAAAVVQPQKPIKTAAPSIDHLAHVLKGQSMLLQSENTRTRKMGR